jgi:hypothetical protein
MTITILIWAFALASVGAFILGSLRIRVFLGQWLRRLRGKKVVDSHQFAVSLVAQNGAVPTTTKRRGYDSPELFRKDTLIRIKTLQARIEENAKRISKIAQRMKEQKKVYDAREKRLEDEDESE